MIQSELLCISSSGLQAVHGSRRVMIHPQLTKHACVLVSTSTFAASYKPNANTTVIVLFVARSTALRRSRILTKASEVHTVNLLTNYLYLLG